MTVPILAFYAFGILFFLIGLEGGEEKIRTIIYLGLSFFINYMAYSLSYQDVNYLSAAYLPLVLMAISIVLAIYTAWGMIPTKLSWSEEADKEDNDV